MWIRHQVATDLAILACEPFPWTLWADHPPKALTNIRGAILLSSFASGAGYLPSSPDLADRNLFQGGMAADHHILFYPNSAPLAGMHRWPAAFFGKGLWDRAETLQSTIAAYDRIPGAREIVVSRGPHSIETWPESERLRERMVAFAKVALVGGKDVPGAAPWTDLRSLMATTPDVWEPSSAPRRSGACDTHQLAEAAGIARNGGCNDSGPVLKSDLVSCAVLGAPNPPRACIAWQKRSVGVASSKIQPQCSRHDQSLQRT